MKNVILEETCVLSIQYNAVANVGLMEISLDTLAHEFKLEVKSG